MTERMSIKILEDAAALQRKKSQDYQNPNSTVVQADYYPNGVSTIQDIIWGKVLRARSLIEGGQAANFESLEDTYLDIINYASFAVAYLRGGVPGQDPERDSFNKPRPRKAEPAATPYSITPDPLWRDATLVPFTVAPGGPPFDKNLPDPRRTVTAKLDGSALFGDAKLTLPSGYVGLNNGEAK